MIREQWHTKLMKKIIQKSDQIEFAKIIYFASPEKFVEKLERNKKIKVDNS